MVDIPELPNGKESDIASIRTLGSGFYEVDGVNDNSRADVMGHARISDPASAAEKAIAGRLG